MKMLTLIGRIFALGFVLIALAGCASKARDEDVIDGKQAKVYFAFYKEHHGGIYGALGMTDDYGDIQLMPVGAEIKTPVTLETRAKNKPSSAYLLPGTYYINRFSFNRGIQRGSGVEGNLGSLIVGSGEVIYLGHFAPDLQLDNAKKTFNFSMTEESDVEEFLAIIRAENPTLASRLQYKPLRGSSIRPPAKDSSTK